MQRVLLALLLSAVLLAVYRLLGIWLDQGPDGVRMARFDDLTLLFAVMPGYFLAMSRLIARRTELAIQQLHPMVHSGVQLPEKLARLRPMLIGGAIGFVYGAWDMYLDGDGSFKHSVLEWSLRAGNGLVWLSAGAVFAWRLDNARIFYRLGQQLQVDPFNLERVRPLGRMATTDVFVVMGAMALTPLQSMSTDFVFAFYRMAFLVGIAASVIFLILPQLGVHQRVLREKSMRVLRLQTRIDGTDPLDYVAMETLLAHRDRLQDAPAWPTDTKGFGRALFYLVVPPLAWVGAAIVERGVDQLF